MITTVVALSALAFEADLAVPRIEIHRQIPREQPDQLNTLSKALNSCSMTLEATKKYEEATPRTCYWTSLESERYDNETGSSDAACDSMFERWLQLQQLCRNSTQA